MHLNGTTMSQFTIVIVLIVGHVVIAQDTTTVEPDVGVTETSTSIDYMEIQCPEDGENLCLTKDCIANSNLLFENMNEKADPCDDFYEFACGGFVKNKDIPDDKQAWHQSFSVMGEVIYKHGRQLLEAVEDHHDEDDFESYKMARQHYRDCSDEEALENAGVEPILEYLKLVGGWPVLEGDNWTGEGYTWWDQIHKIHKIGFNTDTIIKVYMDSDSKNTTYKTIFFDQARTGMSRVYLLKGVNDTDVKAYFNYMVSMAELLGADRGTAETELMDVLKLEIALVNISAAREQRRNKTALYNPTTLGEFSSKPGLPPSWTAYVQNLMNIDGYEVEVDANQKIIIYDKGFFANISNVLSSVDNRTLVNYLGWRMVQEASIYLNAKSREIRHNFNKLITGVQSPAPAWKRCVKEVGFNTRSKRGFIYAAGSMYVKEYFKPEAKAAMVEMTRYLRESFKETLDDLEWMDEPTKDKALKKLHKMKQYLAYPDEFLNKDLIDGFYQGVEMKENDFLGNVLRLKRHWKMDALKRFQEPFDSNDWREHTAVAVVNAYYLRSYNYFEFPAGILHGVFFNNGRPKYMNYGGIGVVIGHEITHGFDDLGRQSDENGNLIDWWSDTTDKAFRERAQCFINQYGNFTATQVNLKLNGINTQAENIADNGGVQQSYRAYGKWVEDNGEEPLLPGFKYSPRQMFWIAHSQLLCAKFRDGALKKRILTGVHSPEPFRLRGPLLNSKDFANDFNCPLGSPMNPVQKCSIW